MAELSAGSVGFVLEERSVDRTDLKWRSIALLGLICVMSVGAHLWITRHGHGISPDSVSYLRIAEGLAAGDGFGFRTVRGEFNTLIHWPVLYPTLLWAVGLIVGGPRHAGALIQTALVIPNLLLLARLAFLIGNRSWAAALVCASVGALSLEFIRLHTSLLSEPLFVCVALVGVLVFADAIRINCWKRLCAAAAVLSIAWLARYAGAGIILPLCVATVAAWRGTIARRAGMDAVFGAIASVPMVAWLVWGWAQTQSLANREFSWHSAGSESFTSGLASVGHWLVGTDFGSDDWGIALGAAQIVLIVVACVWIRRRDCKPAPALAMTCCAAAVGYVVFLVLSLCFFDAYTPLDYRTLFPAQVLTIPVVCGAFVPLIERSGSRALRVLVSVTCLVVIAGRTVPVVQWAKDASDDRMGYASASWQRSPLLQAVRELPADAILYCNRADAVYICAGRDGLALARTHNPVLSGPNTRLQAQIRNMRNHVTADSQAGRPVYAVLFKSGRNCLGKSDLARLFAIEPAGQYRDGALIRLRPLRPTTQPVTSARR